MTASKSPPTCGDCRHLGAGVFARCGRYGHLRERGTRVADAGAGYAGHCESFAVRDEHTQNSVRSVSAKLRGSAKALEGTSGTETIRILLANYASELDAIAAELEGGAA